MKLLQTLFVVAFASSLLAVNAMADPVSFTTGNLLISGLGDEIGSGLDTFAITGLSGVATDSSPVKIGTYAFNVGYNCNSCTLTPSGVTTGFKMTINGLTLDILFPWTWSSNFFADTLIVGAPAPVTFGNVTVKGVALGPLSSTGTTVSGDVMATFSSPTATPEPETYAMLMVGLGLLGFLARRRQTGYVPTQK